MRPIISTLPKAGTGLLAAVFKAVRINAQIGHFEFSSELVGVRPAACLIRDPRDVAVSFAHYFQSGRGGYRAKPYMQMCRDAHELQVAVSVGVMARRLNQIDAWVRAPDMLVIRYEDIVGSSRGGDDARQADSARRIAERFDADGEALREAFRSDHSTPTLRRGLAGAWREEMAPEIANGIVALNSELMIRWGYL